MEKKLIIIFLSLSLLMLLEMADAGEKIIMFLFAGIIPGTNISLSPNTMIFIYTLTICALTSQIILFPIYKKIKSILNKKVKLLPKISHKLRRA